MLYLKFDVKLTLFQGGGTSLSRSKDHSRLKAMILLFFSKNLCKKLRWLTGDQKMIVKEKYVKRQ